jgi:hypothetical protein
LSAKPFDIIGPLGRQLRVCRRCVLSRRLHHNALHRRNATSAEPHGRVRALTARYPRVGVSRGSTKALPMFGCPANGTLRVGLKIRIRAVCAGSSGGRAKVLSMSLNSRAMACICAVVRPAASCYTATGLPWKRRLVNTSAVTKRRRGSVAFSIATARLGSQLQCFNCRRDKGSHGFQGGRTRRPAGGCHSEGHLAPGA